MKQSLLKKLWLRTSMLVAVILCGAGTAWGQVAKIGETTYTSLADAFTAATDGQTITVLTDIDLPSTIAVTKQVTLDLDGKKIFNTSDLWVDGNWSFFSVQANGNLTVTGNGSIDAKENDCFTFDVRDGGILTIKDGTYTGNISSVYLINEAGTGVSTCNIEGGTFSIKQIDGTGGYNFLLNCLDASYKNNTAKFNVTGGSFVNYNPANNQAEGAETNFCAAGYEAVQDGNVWTVHYTAEQIQLSAPIIFHDGGEYEDALTVAIAGEGTIMYKLNDGEATAYTAPITINATTKVTAWAEKDGVKSDEVTKTFTIETAEAGPAVEDNYYTIKNNGNGKFVNVAGRKTVTFVDDATAAAGTVIRVKTNAEKAGQLEVIRSQGVDLPGYAEKAMNYVPKIVELAVEKLKAEGSGAILGEHGLDLIMEKFKKSFDYHLYLENGTDGYRIYGRTPSMQPVVDFYAENKANVDAKLPKLEAFINSAIDKVLDKTDGRGASILVDFKLHDVWQNMPGKLTEPTDDASTLKFYEQVLSSETNVWNFAYQTAMIYWGNLKNHPRFAEIKDKLGDYAKYIDKVENIRPNFKYYIVQKDNKIDFISEGNSELNAAFTSWKLEPRSDFKVKLDTKKTVTVYPTSGGTQMSYDEFYTTLYTDFAYTLPKGVKAYKVTAITDQGVAKREEITGTIPAQTPVLLVGESNEAMLTLSKEAGTAITDNLLVGPDALINEYPIQTPQVVDLFEFAKSILGESAYKTYLKEYEHLMAKNAGTVNNKYFFGLTEEDVKKCVYDTEDGEDCVVRGLDVSEGVVAFHDNWKVSANSAFLVSEEFSPVKLFLVGDVNRDGAVSIADVTALVNIILGKAKYPEDNDKYDFEAANVNGDKTISIADVTALVNIILGK